MKYAIALAAMLVVACLVDPEEELATSEQDVILLCDGDVYCCIGGEDWGCCLICGPVTGICRWGCY